METRKTLQIRIVILGVALLAVSGCSISPKSNFFSLNDEAAPAGFDSRRGEGFAAPRPNSQNIAEDRVARAREDRAPVGSYTKAAAGALDDRSYARAQLDTAEALNSINAYRNQNGLRPLHLDALLTKAAKAHARDLATWDRISHFGSDGSNPWDRVKRSGYNARLAAENVGTGQATFEEVMTGWRKSEEHNKNLLLHDAEHIGIALVYDPNTEFRTFWTLVIGAPA